jgi:hypothetical protein
MAPDQRSAPKKDVSPDEITKTMGPVLAKAPRQVHGLHPLVKTRENVTQMAWEILAILKSGDMEYSHHDVDGDVLTC